MKKNNHNLIIGIILTFLLYACLSTEKEDRLEIYGYALGDTLTNEFEIVKVQDFPFSRAILIKDKRVEVSLVNNNITAIHFENLIQKEQIDLKEMISKEMESDPEYYNGETPFNVKITGEVFYWHDNVKGTEVLLGKDIELGHLAIYNHKISDSLINTYAPDIDTCNYEIMDIE